MPLELIYTALDFVPLGYYWSISLTNKAIHAFCSACLYRYIDLRNHPGRSLLLARTLIESEPLSRLVRAYSFADCPRGFLPVSWEEERSHRFDGVHQLAARKLSNAEAITLHVVPQDFEVKFPRARCARLKVRQLADAEYRMAANFSCSITSLELPPNFGFGNLLYPPTSASKLSFNSEDLPNLLELVAPLKAAYQLVPGRRIRKLVLLMDQHPPNDISVEAHISALGRGLETITRLGLRCCAPNIFWTNVLTSYMMYLPKMLCDVEVLALDTTIVNWFDNASETIMLDFVSCRRPYFAPTRSC